MVIRTFCHPETASPMTCGGTWWLSAPFFIQRRWVRWHVGVPYGYPHLLSTRGKRARWHCRSKEFAFDVLMMPYDRDDLMSYENALLKFNSRQQSKSTRYSIKKISSILRKEFQIEIAKVLAKKFKLKSLFHVIYSLVIDYQWPKIICNSHYKFEFKLYTV